jgi:hypothetical protein
MQGLIDTPFKTSILMTARRVFVCICVLFIGCKTKKTKIDVDPTWIKHNLPNGWTISAPSKFRTGNLQGIDSQPGYISSAEDSILLNYDTGTDMLPKNRDCDFSKEVQNAKSRILNQEEDYSGGIRTLYDLRIDTIDEKVAIIKTPKIKGNGQMTISIQDCKTGAWIGIHGKDFNLEREKFGVKIFETIKLDE